MEQSADPAARSHVARITYRVGQGLAYLSPRRRLNVDKRLVALLRPAEFRLLGGLTTADRAHHLNVYDRLVRNGVIDQELLTAALLHDVGKTDGEMNVGLVQRTVAVLLASVAPSALRTVADPNGRRWRRKFWLVCAHPERGAAMARSAGCSERVCWLIAHHHDSEQEDTGLMLLRQADEGAL